MSVSELSSRLCSSNPPSRTDIKSSLRLFIKHLQAEAPQDGQRVESKQPIESTRATQDLYQLVFVTLPPSISLYLFPDNEGREVLFGNQSQKWNHLGPTLKAFSQGLITWLENVPVHGWALNFVLKYGLQGYTRFWTSFPKQMKRFVLALIKIWSMAQSTVEEHSETVDGESTTHALKRKRKPDTAQLDTSASELKLLALIHLKRIAEYHPSLSSMIIKSGYKSFSKLQWSHTVSDTTRAHVHFLLESLTELCSNAPSTATYPFAFKSIRGFAVSLRLTIVGNTKGKEERQSLYHWRTIHCLAFWTLFLAQAKDEPRLGLLLYPLIQVLKGAASMANHPQMIPYKIQILILLLNLQRDCQIWIPELEESLLELIDTVSDYRNKSSKNLKELELNHILKVEQAYIGTRIYQECVLKRIMELLEQCMHIKSSLACAPEMIFPILQKAKALMKKTHHIGISKLLQKYMKNGKELMEQGKLQRNTFSPLAIFESMKSIKA